MICAIDVTMVRAEKTPRGAYAIWLRRVRRGTRRQRWFGLDAGPGAGCQQAGRHNRMELADLERDSSQTWTFIGGGQCAFRVLPHFRNECRVARLFQQPVCAG